MKLDDLNAKVKEKIQESLTSVLPISAIVFVLSVTVVPIPIDMTMMFLAGAVMLIVGMGLFSLGADMAMMPMGTGFGSQLSKSKSIIPLVVVTFLMGTLITVAEPDLQVLADQVPAIPDEVIVLTVAFGVGVFLSIAMLRTRFGVPLPILIIVSYVAIFALTAAVPRDFIAVAFDSGGVTTGPMTVPFLMTLGVGMASSRARGNDDSFGTVALCSVGPVLAVLVLGIIYAPKDAISAPVEIVEILTTADVARHFVFVAPKYIKEVALAVFPIVVMCALFQLLTRRWTKASLIQMSVGFAYTAFGLILFLTGVSAGFIPVGNLIGVEIAGSEFKWALIPLGALIGYYIVVAEPAIHVLNKQVEEVSGGAISRRAMRLSLSIGVAAAISIAMLRILTGMSLLWFIVPGYALALLLTLKTPKIFIGIAYDSGGVASGPMTSTFILPFAMGACESVGGNILTDAFGVVALVAMTPLITIQMLGLVYARQENVGKISEAIEMPTWDEIVDLEEDAP